MDCTDGRCEIRLMLLLVLASAVFCAIVQISGVHSSVMEGYFPYADAMLGGTLPYTDEVAVYGGYNVWEYPPLAYLFFLVPRLFSDNPSGYQIAYVAMMLLIVWIGMREAGRISHLLGVSHRIMAAAYFLLVLILLEFVLDRFDMLVVVACMAAMRMFLEDRCCAVAALLGLGTLVKLFPAILVPVFAVYLASRREWSVLGRSALSYLAVCLLALPFIATGDIQQMFGYHGCRPLEIECFAASLLNIVACLVPDSGMSWVFSYGSDNIVGGLADAVLPLAEPAMVAIMAAILLWFWHMSRRDSGTGKDAVAAASSAAVCCFILFGTVFSGQYVMWLIPFVLLMSAAGPGRNVFGSAPMALFICAVALTQLDFLINFGLRDAGAPVTLIGALVILARNLLVLWLTIDSIRRIRGYREASGPPAVCGDALRAE